MRKEILEWKVASSGTRPSLVRLISIVKVVKPGVDQTTKISAILTIEEARQLAEALINQIERAQRLDVMHAKSDAEREASLARARTRNEYWASRS
jgi:hypothetical protein